MNKTVARARFNNPEEMKALKEVFHVDNLTKVLDEDPKEGTGKLIAEYNKRVKRKETVGNLITALSVLPPTRNNSIIACDLAKFSEGKIQVTDLKLFSDVNTNIDANFLINHDQLLKILKKLDKKSEIDFQVEGDKVWIMVDGDRSFGLPNQEEDFPCVNVDAWSYAGKICNEDLQHIGIAVKYAGTDELRPVLTGVGLFADEMCGTDAHKLMWCGVKSSLQLESAIIPAKAAKIISKWEDADMFISENGVHAKFIGDNQTLTVRLIDDKYPNYKAVIPDNTKSITVSKKEILKKLDRALIVADKMTNKVLFNITDKVELRSEDLDFHTEYKDTISANIVGEAIQIGFNGKFIQQSIKDMTSDDITISMSEPNRACVISSPDDDFKVLVMPVMLNN